MNDEPMTHETAHGFAAAYVLGALEPAEEAAVREHLRTCPEPHDEFAELGGVVPYLAELPGLELVEPPASLRDRIMAAAAADLAERRATTPTAPAAPASPAAPMPAAAPPAGVPGSTVPFPSAPERAERAARTGRGAGTLGWVARIAAVVAIVVLGGWNLVLQGQLSDARAYDRAVAAVIDAAGEPGNQTVVLTPTKDGRGAGIAAVAADGSVVMALRDLPATTGTQVYEAWVIAAGSPAPVPVGGFTVGPTGTAAFTTQPVATPPGSTIALSLEPSAGSTTPRGAIVATGVSTAPKS
ncbi:MAG TPA: anti-sigma factor [Methylomirabilota bacterium]|nr:anti-sigma factor [Methylomirabilota bacterium]